MGRLSVGMPADVAIANNMIEELRFSAILANIPNIRRIVGSNCVSVGKTEIYAEFTFESSQNGDNTANEAVNGIAMDDIKDSGDATMRGGNVARNLNLRKASPSSGAGWPHRCRSSWKTPG